MVMNVIGGFQNENSLPLTHHMTIKYWQNIDHSADLDIKNMGWVWDPSTW